jgi:hypothetical protein
MADLNSPNNLGFALRDYHHAAKTFTQEPGYTKTPYTGFNFHVSLSFNNLLGRFRGIETKDISVLVKSTDLPETQFETETLNQYNRKRIINKRVVYQPIKLEFHDDIANNIRNMWIAYNQHYNADSNHSINSTWNIDDVYANYSLNRRYGLDNGNSLPFINKIEIFSMGNGEYSKMLLVNPMINSAQFSDHEYSDAAKTMSMSLTIEYENVIYSAGTNNQISDFGKNNLENYDQNKSLLEETNLNARMSNVSIRQSADNQAIVEDTLIDSDNLAIRALNVPDIDLVSGNVSKINSNNSSTVEQYEQSKSITVVQSSQNNQFSFPNSNVSVTENINQFVQSAQSRPGSAEEILANTTPTITNSSSISSNGANISSNNSSNNVNSSFGQGSVNVPTALTSAETDTAEIIINPIIPNNLTTAEQHLFVSSYPPLSSTNVRATKPPYV